MFVGLIVVGFAGGIVAYLRWTAGPDTRRAKLLAQGEAGTARILGWERTGIRHGSHDVLRFTLAIRPLAGGPEFQGTADRPIRPMEAPQFQTGQERPVRVLRDGQRVRVELE